MLRDNLHYILLAELQNMPQSYDLSEAFIHFKATQLSYHQPWDCGIDLLPSRTHLRVSPLPFQSQE